MSLPRARETLLAGVAEDAVARAMTCWQTPHLSGLVVEQQDN
jgi:hypothetical protein